MEDNFAQKQKFWLKKEVKNRYKRENYLQESFWGGMSHFFVGTLIGVYSACLLPMFSGKKGVKEQATLFGSENWNRGQTCRKVRSAFGGVGGGSIWDPSPQHKPNLPQVVAASPRCTATNTTTGT